MARVCRQEGYLIPVLGEPEEMEKYEGAVVLHPDKAIHNSPVGVCDFNSLYPSCIISENLSHNSFVGSVVVKPGESTDYRGRCLDPNNKYEQCLVEGKYIGWDYVDIVHDIYKLVPKGIMTYYITLIRQLAHFYVMAHKSSLPMKVTQTSTGGST